MGLQNRRLLLLDDDIPASTVSPLPLIQTNQTETTTTDNSSSPPQSMPRSSSTPPSRLPPSPVLDANVAYTMLVLLTALFFLGFISNYIRHFTEESAALRRRRRPSTHMSWNYYSSSSCYGGVDPATIQSLPVFKYHSDVKQRQQQLELDCAICLSEFQEGEILKVIPYCEHVFHPECIDMWLASHVTCPVCRSTMFLQRKGNGDGGLGTVDKRGAQAQGVGSHRQGSTVENGMTCRHDGEVGSHSERRTGSWSNSEGGSGRLMLRRTLSI
ncbi:hypothetical protein L6164_022044 [Bauhinia variegata]|uniref:Uncharacterized protein n=1 Tax=Bauhinia variegata TaxID=167791 RepID=A0ACB9MFS9_BAUVA|nr:hypothetical protein L6164_022044 [Bauhinia variegata]